MNMFRIFITGINSFVGQELTKLCQSKEIEVWGVDLQPSCKNLSDAHYIQGDVRNLDWAHKIPKHIDAIVHLAALSRDADCKNKGLQTFEINVMGTLKLMEAAQAAACKQFIFASTEWVYGQFNGYESKDENSVIDLSAIKSEYAASKYVTEVNLRQKFEHGFCPVTVLRFGIIYGPRETNWSAVESLFNAVKTQAELTIGSRQTARKFIHVSDIAQGILASLNLSGFHIINLEGSALISLGQIIDASCDILGKSPQVIETNSANPNIRNVTSRNVELLKGWKPEWDLIRGLKSL